MSIFTGSRAPNRSRRSLRLAYDSLRLASRLAVVSTAAAYKLAAYGGLRKVYIN